MGYSLFIARRLSLGSGRKHRGSPAVAVACIAVALSVAVMLASIMIVLGFKREIRNKVFGFNSHITLTVADAADDEGSSLVSLTPSLKRILDEEPYITGYSLDAAIPALLKTQSNFKGVYMKTLSEGHASDFIKKNLEEGKLPDFDKEPEAAVLSENQARQLGLKAGEKTDVYFITDGIKVRRMPIAAIYNSHFDAYDDVYVYGSKKLIDEIGGIPAEKGTSIRIQTDDFTRIDEYTARLRNRLAKGYADGEIYRIYSLDNALSQGRGYFNWLALLDTNVAVVLILMTIVSIITLISGLLIIILDKMRFIGLMKALGAPNKALRRIFIYLAIRVATVGLITGNALMLTLLWLQDRFHFIPLDAENYYIDFVPVEFNWWLVCALNAGVLLVIWLSLILPSRFIARISPAVTIRYEE